MPRRCVRISLMITVMALAGCSESPAAPADLPPIADPLFEVEVHGVAVSSLWNGFYVDREGHVVSYDLIPGGTLADLDSVMTAEQLAAKYDHARELVKTLPAGQAAAKYELVAQAAAGPYTARQGACLDSPLVSYGAWVYREADGKYHRVLLHMRGSQAQANQSAAATALYHWLADVTGTTDPHDGCDPNP